MDGLDAGRRASVDGLDEERREEAGPGNHAYEALNLRRRESDRHEENLTEIKAALQSLDQGILNNIHSRYTAVRLTRLYLANQNKVSCCCSFFFFFFAKFLHRVYFL